MERWIVGEENQLKSWPLRNSRNPAFCLSITGMFDDGVVEKVDTVIKDLRNLLLYNNRCNVTNKSLINSYSEEGAVKSLPPSPSISV